MLHELSPLRYASLEALLGDYSDYPVVKALMEGNTLGRVYVDEPETPQSAFVLTIAGFSYLLGSPKNKAFNCALKDLLHAELFPTIRLSEDPSLIFYPLAGGWESPIKEMLVGHQVLVIFRKQFSFDKQRYLENVKWNDSVPVEFSMHAIDQEMLEKYSTKIFPWETMQKFLEKGFGLWLMVGDQVVCKCWTVFASSTAVEIEIQTDVQYRRKGLATITALAFIEECLARGLRPNWECWWDNTSSVSLAQRLGFEPIGEQPVFLVELI